MKSWWRQNALSDVNCIYIKLHVNGYLHIEITFLYTLKPYSLKVWTGSQVGCVIRQELTLSNAV